MSSRKQKGQFDGKIAGLYDLEETIGSGHFAVVKLARHVFTGEKVAVKVIDKMKLDDVSKAHLFQEVRCMKLVQHPNVVRLYEVIDTQTKLYLILELGDGGDMYDYIMRHDKGLAEEVARRYFNQIVQAINYCHKLHVVHRDLKPENVVFFEKLGIVKLTDFGFSNKFIPGRKLETSCGSLAYSAPEILLGDSYDAPAVDVWSLGVILYMLVCGEAPFQEANDSETLTMIMDCKYRMPTHVSDQCQNVISKMLVREPRDRANLECIMGHDWLQFSGQVPRGPIMPLISRQDLPPDDHDYILQKMVEGKIASMEEILQSLENNSYDHITATFYLLAERRLRRHHEAAALIANQKKREETGTQGNKANLAPLALSPRSAHQKLVDGQVYTCSCDEPGDACPCVRSADSSQKEKSRHQNLINSLVSPPGVHPSPHAGVSTRGCSPSPSSPAYPGRKCSLIHEESIEEDEDEMEGEDGDQGLHEAHSAEAISEDSSSAGGSPARHGTPSRRSGQGVRPLHSVRSSPQLLNQIFEEGESEDDDFSSKKLTSPRMHIQRKSIPSPEVLKFEHRKKRLTSSSRGTSCSSSDASDTDDTEGRKRKEKLKQRMSRRDSSDHSSDTDGPTGPGGPSGGSRSFHGGGSGTDRDRRKDRDKDRDRDRGGKGGNDENRQGFRGTKERRHSLGGGVGKQNSLSVAKRDSLHSSGSENLPQLEVSRKISTLSVGSNLSNLSLTSITSRSSKYLIESSPNTPRSGVSPNSTDVDALNEENKARTKIIHVRSKEFSDLMDRFGHSDKNDKTSSNSSKEPQVKFRRRSKEKMKTDINRNGLIAKADGELTEAEAREQQQKQQQQVVQSGVVTTKCCSLV